MHHPAPKDTPPTTDTVRAALISYIQTTREVPCPACAYNLTGLASLRCPECGREYSMADLGVRPRPAWLAFARGGWGWLTLLLASVGLAAWTSSLRPPHSEVLRLLFFYPGAGNGQLGVVTGAMLLFQTAWFWMRISRRPHRRARAGDALMVAWGLMVIEVLGVVLTILV